MPGLEEFLSAIYNTGLSAVPPEAIMSALNASTKASSSPTLPPPPASAAPSFTLPPPHRTAPSTPIIAPNAPSADPTGTQQASQATNQALANVTQGLVPQGSQSSPQGQGGNLMNLIMNLGLPILAGLGQAMQVPRLAGPGAKVGAGLAGLANAGMQEQAAHEKERLARSELGLRQLEAESTLIKAQRDMPAGVDLLASLRQGPLKSYLLDSKTTAGLSKADQLKALELGVKWADAESKNQDTEQYRNEMYQLRRDALNQQIADREARRDLLAREIGDREQAHLDSTEFKKQAAENQKELVALHKEMFEYRKQHDASKEAKSNSKMLKDVPIDDGKGHSIVANIYFRRDPSTNKWSVVGSGLGSSSFYPKKRGGLFTGGPDKTLYPKTLPSNAEIEKQLRKSGRLSTDGPVGEGSSASPSSADEAE